MSSISIVLLLLILTIASLLTVHLINSWQVRTRAISKKVAQIKCRFTALESLSVTIESLVDDKKIAQLINKEAILLLKNMFAISPKDTSYQTMMERAQLRSAQLRDPGRQVDTFRLMDSDAAIAKSHYALTEAVRIVQKTKEQENIDAKEAGRMIKDLLWSDFMVKIVSHVGQGHKARNEGDKMRARAFYEKALALTSEKILDDHRQKQTIDELKEILADRRLSLSTQIMPEVIYNPSSNSN